MSKILVTGFDPFGGEPVNPAFEAVKLLPESIAGVSVVKLEIPTVFTRSAMVVEEAIEREKPDYVLCIGQAGGRSAVTVEKVAINLAEAASPTTTASSHSTPRCARMATPRISPRCRSRPWSSASTRAASRRSCRTRLAPTCATASCTTCCTCSTQVPRSQGRLHPRAVRDRAGRGQAERHAHHGNHDNGQGIEAAIEAAVSVEEDATDIMGETH